MLAICLSTPGLAQQGGFCATECSYKAEGEQVVFLCGDAVMQEKMNAQKVPAVLAGDRGHLAIFMSQNNPEWGMNIAKPGVSGLFWPCASNLLRIAFLRP